jgi:hypothetical protein
MKGGLLRLHPLYQFFDPIKSRLIGDPGRQALVMLNLAVEFDTLVTHRDRSNRGATLTGRLGYKTIKRESFTWTRIVQMRGIPHRGSISTMKETAE